MVSIIKKRDVTPESLHEQPGEYRSGAGLIDIFKFATPDMTRHLAAAAARCRVISILKNFQEMVELNVGEEMRGRN
jgi:hypothetical protein